MNRTPQSSQATGVPSEKPVVAKTGSEPSLPSRRNFIGKVGGATAAAWAASALGLSPLLSSTKAKAAVLHANTSVGGQARRTAAYQLRLQVALNQFNKPLPNQINNGDEKLYNNTFIGQYSKALRHTTIGDPDPGSYRK